MRRRSPAMVMAVLALIAISSLIQVGLAASTSSSASRTGTWLSQEAVVASLTGSAWVMHDIDPDGIEAAVKSFSESGASGWTRLTTGDSLKKLDLVVVSSSGDSVLSLVCADMSVLQLGPGSILFIQDTLTPAKGIFALLTRLWQKPSLRVILGTLWASVTKRITPGSQFEVETPAAVAGVRGTKFEVSVAPTGATTVYVEEGVVEVRGLQHGKPQGAPVVVAAGQATYVEPGKPPTRPTDLPEEARKGKAFWKSGRPDEKPVPPGQSKEPKGKDEDEDGNDSPPDEPGQHSRQPGEGSDDQGKGQQEPQQES